MGVEDIAEALKALNAGLKIEPKNDGLLQNKGNVLNDLKDGPGAVAIFTQLVRKAPTNASVDLKPHRPDARRPTRRDTFEQDGPDRRGNGRRGGRVVECTALEMRRAGDGTQGSNPCLSASFLSIHCCRGAFAR